MTEQTFSYDRLAEDGVTVVRDRAVGIDPISHRITLGSGASLGYERLILAPGVSLDFEALEGYSEAAANRFASCLASGRTNTSTSCTT